MLDFSRDTSCPILTFPNFEQGLMKFKQNSLFLRVPNSDGYLRCIYQPI